jgi:hypothetical protein
MLLKQYINKVIKCCIALPSMHVIVTIATTILSLMSYSINLKTVEIKEQRKLA